MGFFDKVKNMFTEEVEDDEVKVEQIKNEVTHVSIESPNAKKEEYEEENTQEFKFEKTEKINKPVFFDDNDFSDLNYTKKMEEPKIIEKEKPKEVKEVYGSKIQPERREIVEKKAFKPTPIISPVYGILDKNYHKEDIVSREEFVRPPVVNNIEEKEPSIDSIRNKAYGTLEDELENTLFGSNSILFKKDEEENVEINEISDDALTNLTDDISKELDELLIKKEKYLDDEVESYEDNSSLNDDLLGFIDSTLYKNGDEE
ncbi:MAG: hypothetical protein IJY25_02685 [Bacilli bacterium]|nr:hypothetical protein [Bacilli bacterium]